MELSVMVAQLKEESESITKVLTDKTRMANSLRKQLAQIETEIKSLTDRHDAIRMAVDSLELISDGKSGEKEAVVPEQTKVQINEPVKARMHSRKPKKIGKFTPNGTKIGEFSSINKAAKAFGWNNTSMSKYIENTSKEKQIRIRGFYLQFLAA